MPDFEYRARNASGALIEGVIEAASRDAVATQLLNGGNTPLEINETSDAARPAGITIRSLLEARNKPDLLDLVLFSRQMYTLMKAGVPLISALRGLVQTTRNQQMVEALKAITRQIESGLELSTTISAHPHIFPSLFVSMVRVGENTGNLDEAFFRLATHFEREKHTRERIKATLRYPAFLIGAIAIAIGIINVLVIPVFADMFEKSSVPLPWQTRTLIIVSDFFVAYWPIMLIGLAAAIVGFTQYTRTAQGRYHWDRIKLRIPIVGDIINRATLARFCRSLSMALGAGVPVLQSLQIVAAAVDNDYLGENIIAMRAGIERGDSVTQTARGSGMFTPLVLQMLAVGEESGRIDHMLEEVAEFYEREVDYDIENLSASLEPIIIVMIGAMVLILALGVFLPMWDMSTAIG